MGLNVIQVERELEDRLRARAREALGPDASETEAKALAEEVYYGGERTTGITKPRRSGRHTTGRSKKRSR